MSILEEMDSLVAKGYPLEALSVDDLLERKRMRARYIGERAKAVVAAGKRVEDIAKRYGVDRRTVYRWMNQV